MKRDSFPDFDRIDRLLAEAEPQPMMMTAPRAFVLVAQLQFALRHPGNNGESAEIARDMARRLQAWLGSIDPAIAAALDQGWHPEFDLTRDEFKEMEGGVGEASPKEDR